jgi:steroid delta-isomerase-like uncharacterized protein
MQDRIALMMMLAAALAACAPSREALNKAIAHRAFTEVLSEGHFDRAAQLYAPDFKNHGLHRDVSLQEDQEAARGWKQAFPDGAYSIEKMIAEGDQVAVLWIGRGTNTGAGNGLPATGKRAELRGVTIWRIVGGRIHDEWSEFDESQIPRQLGLEGHE